MFNPDFYPTLSEVAATMIDQLDRLEILGKSLEVAA